jgi:hypothetical protein
MTKTAAALLIPLALALGLAGCRAPDQEGHLPPPAPGDERLMDAAQPDTQRVPPPR